MVPTFLSPEARRHPRAILIHTSRLLTRAFQSFACIHRSVARSFPSTAQPASRGNKYDLNTSCLQSHPRQYSFQGCRMPHHYQEQVTITQGLTTLTHALALTLTSTHLHVTCLHFPCVYIMVITSKLNCQLPCLFIVRSAIMIST